MESPIIPPTSPAANNNVPLKSSNSSTKVVDDVTSLTSFNPFSEEDEHESSYTLVSSLFSRVKNSFAAPLSSAVAVASGASSSASNAKENSNQNEQRRASGPTQITSPIMRPVPDKLRPKIASTPGPSPAPPAVYLFPAISETPTINADHEKSYKQNGLFSSLATEANEGGLFGTAIPGFPIQDDARSIHTTVSLKRSASVSKVIRRLRGEGLSKDYWMDDENCKECYDCKSVFTTWRRKHHCRICGQIFCSRCASNIIKGSRFGQDGMVRVCNLCLEKLHHDDEDDDDRRSITSSLSSTYPYNMMDNYLSSLAHHSQSPFASSQLFGRSDELHNLYSIAENKRRVSGSDGSGITSRPLTPGEDFEGSIWVEPPDPQPAPFRRTVTDEDKEPEIESDTYAQDQSPTGPRPGTKTPVEVYKTLPFPINGTKSSIQFPGSSPEHGLDSPRPSSTSRSRVNSYAETEVQTPFLRSRVQSRLHELSVGESGWRTRRESTAYAQELNTISMFHLRLMLRQLLTTEGISNIKEWEETLLKLALRIAKDLTFTSYPYREGADMDVRRYVKIKKIPGGCPKDSEYVDGAVITKNVAHKQMSRSQRNPRIMLVTFPLEFQRVEGQYMHFGQIVRQEKEYLGNLASRIAALRPHVVLAEKSVSRLALEALAKHNITVARSVKESAVQLAARMTQGDVFSSIDKLAFEPRLGHCGYFKLQTFDHPLIPCRRKTYMRFEGCSRDLGCTIILRGGDMSYLRRVKKVTLFLAFIVRNLKLETHLWKDSLITAPHLTADAAPQAYLTPLLALQSSLNSSLGLSGADTNGDNNSMSQLEDDLPSEEAKALDLSRRIQASLDPYLKTFISVSATIRFPPPYPIRRMKELDDELHRARRAWEDEVIRLGEKPITPRHEQEPTITQTPSNIELSLQDDIKAQIEALPSPGIPDSPNLSSRDESTVEGSTSAISTDYFSQKLVPSSSHSSLRSIVNISAIASPVLSVSEEPEFREESDIIVQSALDHAKLQHAEHRRVWEWYIRKNNDDFVVEKYQYISLMEFTVPMNELGHHRACFLPELKYMKFYGNNDCTLGQFIEKSVHDNLVQFLDPKAICSGKACDQPLARHGRVFVHNERRLTVCVEQWDGHIKSRPNNPEYITTWSKCKICGSLTPVIPVSEEMQRYSLAKFLELHFYPADVQLVQGAGCMHNIYQHHERYFSMRNMTVVFQTEPITLYEVIYPPSHVHVRREASLNIKNEDYERLLKRNAQWYTALINDLKLINVDAATGDSESDAALTSQINLLIERATLERAEIASLIQEVYRDTPPTDTLALNRVRAERQDKIVAWEADFDKLPKPKLSHLTEKESRRSTAFGTVRSMWPRRYDLFENLHIPPSSMSENEDMPPLTRRTTGESFTTDTTDMTDTISDVSDSESGTKDEDTASTALEKASIIPEHVKNGSDSDSTIAAVQVSGRPPLAGPSVSVNKTGANEDEFETSKIASRLPRRSGQHPSVADLVKKYQDFLPPSVSAELATSSRPPQIPESDQEVTATSRAPRAKPKNRVKVPIRKGSVSDFERSYAVNVGPKHLTHRRTPGIAQPPSRIPMALPSSLESRDTSRRTSPDKRPTFSRLGTESTARGGRFSPPPLKPQQPTTPGRSSRSRMTNRNQPRDRSQVGRVCSSSAKPTMRKTSNTIGGGKVSNITRHYEKMHKDNERANRRYKVIRGVRARPVASSKATVEVFDSVKEAIKDVSDVSDDSSSEADDEDEGEGDRDSTPEKRKVGAVVNQTLKQGVEPDSNESNVSGSQPEVQGSETSELPSSPTSVETKFIVDSTLPTSPPANQMTFETPVLPELEPGTITSDRPSTFMKAITGFWPRNHMDFEADDFMADPEHIFRESSMVVRTDEPTSIIALTLNSPQYRDMLTKSRAEKRVVREPKLSDGGEVFMPDDCSTTDSNSTWGVVNVDSSDESNPTDDLRIASSKLPWAFSFESGNLTITCTILYPEQFDALRRTYDCEKSMIESLARCVKFNASGGKSGSAFLKTLDDRFIAKELSRPELETMAIFGPAYFDYMSSAVTADRPTLLAKVFGCYKIVFRKTVNEKSGRTKSTSMNLLVMENLFYDRKFTKIFDLKGSMRNRHVQSTGRENEVLLDENLVQTAHLSPFYVREHAKRILRGSLYNDTKFLADIHVMDYSLVVGVDTVKNELVVGIVDYIRTYTWDKKLESWVKESAFLAGAGKGEPTIVTPKQYRQRFLSAMERYFPLVPDRWMKQTDAPEDEGSNLLDLWPDW